MGAGAGEGPGGPRPAAGDPGAEGAAEAALLAAVGARVRARRQAAGLTQAGLAQQAGVSVRFLVALEAGQGNISLGRLWGVCAALRAPLAELLAGLGPGGKEKVALVGLRGAGKSSLGRALAAARGWPFVELDRKVEEAAGMRLGALFELRGEAHFRALEARALDALLDTEGPMVIAAGGSIVTAPETWARLRAGARTAWLKASPAAHLARVQAQGDMRPMQGRPEALAELTTLWTERAPLYGQADLTVDTDLGQDSALRALLGWASG